MSVPSLPSAYRHWQDSARRLLEPLAALMPPGRASLPLAGPASDHDAQADRLEAFARPLLLAAHWLQSVPRPEDAALREKVVRWFREGLVIGTDPRHPEYWGPDASYHQHHVEIGLMALSLQLVLPDLWDPLAPVEKDRVARWFGSARGSGVVNNNHLFMAVHILEFLGKVGRGHRTDRAIITNFLDRLEGMHRGGGWFEDGINQAYDHYNAYAFHFYGLWWARLHGAQDPARAQRWREWARIFVNDYQHFFAASGEHPAFGRSITYRFNVLNVFGLTLAENCTDIPPGRLRRLCTRNLDFFLSRPIQQAQGALAIGWTDPFEPLMESYSCAASPYWCAKGFAPLVLPPSHPFWTVPEEPLPAEQGDFVRIMPSAGLLVRGVGGEVEILNAGSQISNLNLRYGAWKWSKTAYRTGVGFTLAFPPPTNWSFDSAVTLTLDDGRVFGRHSTVPVEMESTHLGYSWGLGFKTGQINCAMETFVWWRAGWLLQVHAYDAHQPGVLRLGGYALPLLHPTPLELSPALRPPASPALSPRAGLPSPASFQSAFSSDGRGTALQPLHGFEAAEWDDRLDDTAPRSHIAAPYHVTPVVRTGRVQGRGLLAALSWTGRDRAEAEPWQVVSAEPGRWRLVHPHLGEWRIEHWALPLLHA